MKYIYLLTFVITATIASAQYALQDVFPNQERFQDPIDMTLVPDGTNRLAVVEQQGVIYLIPNDPNSSERIQLLDITSIVESGGELGLLGLAFDPDFMYNGYFYVNYTTRVPGVLTTNVSRFQATGTPRSSALKESEVRLLFANQPYPNHNGGCVKFGHDGFLYISLGDGGSGGDPKNNGQSDNTMLGKILRIDVKDTLDGKKYGIPFNNPFAGIQDKTKEIYAKGLRNVWKFSFDSETGELWAGDVGQGDWEEVDIITNGGNYGWKIMEGKHCYPSGTTGCDQTGLTLPVWEYSHNQGISITGGNVYRGSGIPSLFGKYIYADYGSGRIWGLKRGEGNVFTNELLIDNPNLVSKNDQISSFAVDHNNELYVVGYGLGRIYKLTGPAASVESPNVPSQYVSVSPNPADEMLTITLRNISSPKVVLSLVDILGHTVLTQESSPNDPIHLNIKELPAGGYLLKIDAGKVSYSQKVVIR